MHWIQACKVFFCRYRFFRVGHKLLDENDATEPKSDIELALLVFKQFKFCTDDLMENVSDPDKNMASVWIYDITDN